MKRIGNNIIGLSIEEIAEMEENKKTMVKLGEKIESIEWRKSAEDKVIKQVMDLELIKYNGLRAGRILRGDDIFNCIIEEIEACMWLYEKGINSKEQLESEEDIERYERHIKNFNMLNDFMCLNMSLKSM